VADSGAIDRQEFGGLAERTLAHTWVSRKLQEPETREISRNDDPPANDGDDDPPANDGDDDPPANDGDDDPPANDGDDDPPANDGSSFAWDGGTAGVADCFLDSTNTQESCESCCGACTETELMDNSASGGCVCSVLGDLSTTLFQGSAHNDCIFIPGDSNQYIYGGEGDDAIIVSGNENGYIYGDDGDDTIVVPGIKNKYISGGDGDDTIIVSGDTLEFYRRGEFPEDWLRHGLNNYQINGGEGDDTITVSGADNAFIYASMPASDAVEERLPFPRAERGPMPPGDSEERACPRPRVVGRRG